MAIRSILFNNSSMAIEIPMMPVSQAKYGATDITGNYADMATSLGCYGERVADPSEIVAALKRRDRCHRRRPARLAGVPHRQRDHHLERTGRQ
jgi:thiamine pyrophosphate-dependent acetolactate synthase large subunit-like protein